MKRNIFKPGSQKESIRLLNLQRKKMNCLGCGRIIVTDRCHRFCRMCIRRNRRNGFYQPKTSAMSIS